MRSYTFDEDKKIMNLYAQKIPVEQIAKKIGRSGPSVAYRLYKILKRRSFGQINYEKAKKENENLEAQKTIAAISRKEEPIQVEQEVSNEESNQHYFKEIYLPAHELENITSAYLAKQLITEEEQRWIEYFKELEGRLLARTFELIEQNMTEHQKKIVALLLKDKTYDNIATLLSINYTAVAHAIKGIKTKKHGKHHGGIERKLYKICHKDKECLSILESIREARNRMDLDEQEEAFQMFAQGY